MAQLYSELLGPLNAALICCSTLVLARQHMAAWCGRFWQKKMDRHHQGTDRHNGDAWPCTNDLHVLQGYTVSEEACAIRSEHNIEHYRATHFDTEM